MNGFLALFRGLQVSGHRARGKQNRGVAYLANQSPRSRNLRLEPLEDRTLLSVGGLNDTAMSVACVTGANQMNVEVRAGSYSVTTASDGTASISASGLVAAGTAGSPELPQKLLRIAVPIDTDLDSVTLTVSANYVTSISGSYTVAPAAAVSTETADGVLTYTDGIELIDGKNLAVYNSNTYYDTACCTLVDVQEMGRWKIAEVQYSPFAYNPVTGALLVATNTSFTLSYTTDDPLPADLATSTLWDSDVSELVVNYNDASLGYAAAASSASTTSTTSTSVAASSTVATSASYVIITTAAIQANSTKLAAFVTQKESVGFSVLVATETTWGGGTGNTASENIRTWLKANYASLGIEYVLLIGNPNYSSGDVPMKQTWPLSGNDSPTDYYYADLTSNWNTDGDSYYGEWSADITAKPIAEVTVGRMPVYDADYASLDSILAKTIAYENETDISWRNSMLLPMAISNYANEDATGVSRTDGVSLAQGISSLATTNGYSTYTMYEQAGLSSVTTSCDAALTAANLISTWSTTDYGIVDWWGHGNDTGAYRKYWAADTDGDSVPDSTEMAWSDFMTSSNVSSLDDSHPSIVVQVSCLNGNSENSSNLGYSLLKNGAIGTYSGTRNTWYYYGTWSAGLRGDNASYAYYITKQLVENTSTSLGDALQWCRENLYCLEGALWMNCTDYNLYGDPSLTPYATTIRGTVYNDSDSDGTRDAAESGESGVTVYIDDNNNGVLDTGTTTAGSGTVNLAINSLATTTSKLTVSNIGGTITDVNVTLTITHTRDSDLTVYLVSPEGTTVTLFSGVGGTGKNFTGTTLDDEASTAIASGSATFSGSYRPSGLLSALDGQVVSGTWTLKVYDGRSSYTGKLVSWSLTICTQEQSIVTASDGGYMFGLTTAGTYNIREVVPTGATQTAPAADYYSVALVADYGVTGKDFGNAPPDTTFPTVTSSTPSTTGPTNADSLVFTVLFSESVINVTTDDFQLTTTGTAAGTITGVSASSGTSFIVTVSGIIGDGAVRLDLKNSTDVQDAAGNVATAYAAGSTATIDNTAPVVTRVLVASTAWSSSFIATLGGIGYAIPDGVSQVLSLPWNNLNKVIIEFSENVTVAQANMALAGVNVTSYGFTAGTFVYDAVAHRATWTISQNLSADKLLIDLDGSTATAVADAAGNQLDGEWTNPTWTLPATPVGGDTWSSGDGTAGGDFHFRFNVLPGDVTQDGTVGFGDLSMVLGNYSQAGDWTKGDFTGDGLVGFGDLSIVLGNYNQSLPTSEPVAPSAASMAAKSTAANAAVVSSSSIVVAKAATTAAVVVATPRSSASSQSVIGRLRAVDPRAVDRINLSMVAEYALVGNKKNFR